MCIVCFGAQIIQPFVCNSTQSVCLANKQIISQTYFTKISDICKGTCFKTNQTHHLEFLMTRRFSIEFVCGLFDHDIVLTGSSTCSWAKCSGHVSGDPEPHKLFVCDQHACNYSEGAMRACHVIHPPHLDFFCGFVVCHDLSNRVLDSGQPPQQRATLLGHSHTPRSSHIFSALQRDGEVIKKLLTENFFITLAFLFFFWLRSKVPSPRGSRSDIL